MHLVISADFSDWLYLAVKLGKGLTAREIRGKKKHKILWCMRESEGVFCGGQYPFCFGLYLGKEEVAGSSPAISSKQDRTPRSCFFCAKLATRQKRYAGGRDLIHASPRERCGGFFVAVRGGRSGGEEGYLGGEEGRAAVAHAEGVAGGEGVHEQGDAPEVVVPVVD